MVLAKRRFALDIFQQRRVESGEGGREILLSLLSLL